MNGQWSGNGQDRGRFVDQEKSPREVAMTEDREITYTKTVQYLGVQLHSKMAFWDQIQSSNNKAKVNKDVELTYG